MVKSGNAVGAQSLGWHEGICDRVTHGETNQELHRYGVRAGGV